MKKRFLALLLALCTLMTLALTGCGGNGGGANSGEKVKLTIGVPQNANVTSYDDNAFTAYLEEKANVELEFVFFPSSGDNYVRQLTLMAAANETMPDILWGFTGMGNNARNEFGDEGYLMDLTDLIDKYAPDYKAAMAKLDDHTREYVENRAVSESGKIYGMPMTDSKVWWDDLQDMLYINQEWLDTLGLKAPTTVDELYTVLKAFKEQDPNGNGLADEIPMFGSTNLIYNITSWVINAYIYYNDTYELNVENGKLYAPFTTDEYREALIFLNKLCREGLLSDLSFSAGTAEMKNMITPGTGTAQVGIWAGHPSVYADQTSPILEQYQPFSGQLKDETGKGGYVVINPNGVYFALMITTDCQNPEAAMRFCNLFYQDETMTRQRHGEKDVDWVEEPGVTATGDEGYIKLINSNAFFKGNRTWCANGAGICTPANYLATMTSTKHYDEVINNLFKTAYEEIVTGIVKPDEVCEDLIYTAAQYETRSQYVNPIKSYALEQRNLFILGTLDPSDNTAWNNYLSELDRVGLQEYLALMQQAYNNQ